MTLLAGLAAGSLLLPAIALGAVQIDLDEVEPRASAVPPAEPSTSAMPRRPTPSHPDNETNRTTTSITSEHPQADSQSTPAGHWSWPLPPAPRVVREFMVGPSPWSPGHRGVDLIAESGRSAAIRAPANGRVHFAGVIAGRPVLSIDHGSGLVSSFEPVISSLRRGQVVQRNDVIGRLGTGPSHCAPASCLHWGVRKDGRYIDPLLLLPGRRGPAVLLPLPRS